MKFPQIVAIVVGITIFATGHWLPGGIIIEETFTGYLDNELISKNPAGPALGLTGDWTVKSENNDFYVNRTQLDLNSGTGKAVYDRESNDNGERTATRLTSADHVLFRNSGDTFYAGFLIDSARASGDMTLELGLAGIDVGGLADFSFGIIKGKYSVGSGGVSVGLEGGTTTAGEQRVVVRVVYGEADGAPETVTLWVNPTDESSTPILNQLTQDILKRGGGKLLSIAIRGGQMAGSPAFFDDLRVGTTFDSAVPEPGTFMMLGIGACLLLPWVKRISRRR